MHCSLVKFHPTRLELFTCSDDCHIRWWSLTTGKQLACLQSHNSLVRGLAFVPGTELLVSGGRDAIVLVWDLDTRVPIKTIPVFETVEALVLMPAETRFPGRPKNLAKGAFHFALAGSKGEIRIFDNAGGCVHTVPCQAELTGCFFDARASQLVATTVEHAIMTFAPEQFERTKLFFGSYDEVVDVRFIGEDEAHVAVATNTEHIQIVDVATMNCTLMHGHTDVVLCLAVSADGRTLASGSKDNSINVWRSDDDGVWYLAAKGVGHAGDVTAVAVSQKQAGGTFLVSGSKDCTMKMWQLPNRPAGGGAPAETVALKASYTRKAHEKDINCLDVAPNDKLVVSAGQDRLAKIWVAGDGGEVGILKGHKRGVWAAKFSPVDQVIATASGDAMIKVWAVADFSCLKTFEGHGSSVLSVQFLCRGMQLLSADADGLLKLWNIKNMEMVDTFDGHEGRVWALAVSKKQDRLVTGSQDGTIVLWKDNTIEVDEVQRAEDDLKVIKTQDLDNLISQEKLQEAAMLALEIRHPYKLLRIVNQLLQSPAGPTAINALVKDLEGEDLGQLLEYVQGWNSNSRNALPAQAVLNAIIRSVPSASLLKVPKIVQLLPPLLAFTERHFNRLATLQQQSRLVDFSWAEMKLGVGDPVDTSMLHKRTPAKADYGAAAAVVEDEEKLATRKRKKKTAPSEGGDDAGQAGVAAEELPGTPLPTAAKTPKSKKKKKKNRALETAEGEEGAAEAGPATPAVTPKAAKTPGSKKKRAADRAAAEAAAAAAAAATAEAEAEQSGGVYTKKGIGRRIRRAPASDAEDEAAKPEASLPRHSKRSKAT